MLSFQAPIAVQGQWKRLAAQPVAIGENKIHTHQFRDLALTRSEILEIHFHLTLNYTAAAAVLERDVYRAFTNFRFQDISGPYLNISGVSLRLWEESLYRSRRLTNATIPLAGASTEVSFWISFRFSAFNAARARDWALEATRIYGHNGELGFTVANTSEITWQVTNGAIGTVTPYVVFRSNASGSYEIKPRWTVYEKTETQSDFSVPVNGRCRDLFIHAANSAYTAVQPTNTNAPTIGWESLPEAPIRRAYESTVSEPLNGLSLIQDSSYAMPYVWPEDGGQISKYPILANVDFKTTGLPASFVYVVAAIVPRTKEHASVVTGVHTSEVDEFIARYGAIVGQAPGTAFDTANPKHAKSLPYATIAIPGNLNVV